MTFQALSRYVCTRHTVDAKDTQGWSSFLVFYAGSARPPKESLSFANLEDKEWDDHLFPRTQPAHHVSSGIKRKELARKQREIASSTVPRVSIIPLKSEGGAGLGILDSY